MKWYTFGYFIMSLKNTILVVKKLLIMSALGIESKNEIQ